MPIVINLLTKKFKYMKPVTPHWTTATQDLLKDIKKATLSDPCLQRFNYKKLIVLRSDVSSNGVCLCVCQPGNGKAYAKAMNV
jgi:hypothetical protein